MKSIPSAPQRAAPRAPDPPADALLAMQDIVHHFGTIPAVDGVTLHVDPGEVVCLLGPSGCGKSTLLRIAAGLERPQRGRVSIGGVRVADSRSWVPPEARQVGLVFQDAALFPHLTVLDNVLFGLEQLPRPRREPRGRALLAQVGIADYAASHPHQLSGGQQQRVALARALAPSPRLMLLDEPFSSLDARLREQIRDDTLHALEQSGTGTLLVTHDPEEAMFMADRIALMNHGRIVQSGTPVELYCRPEHAFVVKFFGEVNRLPARAQAGRVDTPLGPVAATLADGADAEVLIRPEALRIAQVGAATPGHDVRVVTARLLGRHSLIHLSVAGRAGEIHHMHAHVPGVFLPEPGQPVTLSLDESQVFVFPSKEA